MAGLVSEPAKLYWALGIAASLGLHATGVAGAVLLADRFVAAPVSTEITFSDEASPAAAPVAARAEAAARAETATVATAETVAPATAEIAKPETQALSPVQPSVVSAADQERLAPSSAAEATGKPEAEGVQPVTSTEVASAAPPVDRPEGTSVAEPVPAAAPETAPSLAASENVVQGSAETLAATSDSMTVTGEEPEPISVGEPERLSAAPSEPAVGGAERVTAAPAAPALSEGAERVAALDPASERVAGVAAAPPAASGAEAVTGTETVSPVASTEPADGAVTTIAPETVAVPPAVTETAPAVEQPFETALLVPARPDSSLGTAVDKPSDRYRRIVDFIRGYAGGDCFIALPAMSAAGDVTFQTFGRDKDREDAFRQALLGLDGLNAEISAGNVADPQCMALRFAEHARRYPGFSLMIDLDEADVSSGAKLSGAVLNANGRDLHLLLVDDEGQVQSLDRLMAPGDGVDRPFSTPLTLTGGPVATKQILIAITSDRELPSLTDHVRARAAAFFRKLTAEIDASGADIDLAVEGFSVR